MFGKLFNRGEKVDPRPVAIPAGMMLPETAEQKMARMIRTELSRQAVEAGFESFEDSNDFNVADEDPTLSATSYEMASEFMEGLRNGEYEGPGFGEERDSERDRRTTADSERGVGNEEKRSGADGYAERSRGTREDEEQRGTDASRRAYTRGTRTDDRRRDQSEPRRTAASRPSDGRGRDED